MLKILVLTLLSLIVLLGCQVARGDRQSVHGSVPSGYQVLPSDLVGRGAILRDLGWGITGTIDLLLEGPKGELIPVQYQRAWRDYEPGTCRRSHLVQLAVSFVLCEGDSRLRRAPAEAWIRYVDERGRVVPGGEIRTSNTPEARQQVLKLVELVRRAKVSGIEVHRTHTSAYNCRECHDRARCQGAKG